MIIQDNSCYERYTIEILNSGDTATAGAAQSIWSIENVGSGVGVFSGATNHTAKFKSLVAGNNINITSTGNTIVISSSGGTSTNITANNGLTRSGDNIHLGGALTGNTTVDGNGYNINLGASTSDRMGNLRVWSNGTISLDGYTSSFLQSSGSTITANPLGVSISSQSGQLVINGTDIKLTDNRATPRGLSANGDYSANYQKLDYVSKHYVTGFTNYIVTNNNSIVITNQYKNTSIYCTYTGTTNIYIPDTVDSGLTFTSIRAAGLVNHIATGTSTLNSIGNATDIQIENGASTWQYIGNSNWYGYGALGAPLTGSSSTANNGLTKSGDNIYLGGELTGNTAIAAGSFNFSIIGDNSLFELLQDGPVNIISNNGVNIADALGVGLSIQSADGLGDSVIANISPNVFTIDGPTSFAGLQYGVNYGANFTTRSLVDVGFLDGRYTAGNGITKTGTKFSLGGTITGNTSINSNVANTHSFIIGGTTRPQTIQLNAGNVLSNYGNLTINDTQTSLTRNVSNPMSIVLDASGIRISDLLNARGAFYAGDYSANFTVRSLVDKGYVTGLTAPSASNGLTKIGHNITLGGTLTGNTTINSTGYDYTISNSGTLFSINDDATVQLNLGSDATNDIYSRNSSGNLQRIAAGTGSTVLMMNSGGTAHVYSKIGTLNLANSIVTYQKLQNSAGGTRIIGRSANSAGVHAEIVATADGQSLRRVGGVLGFGNASTVSYTVGTLPSAATAGQMIYVSDESGGAVIAFSDGTNWRRVTDRNIVS